ncbi:distal membrane-arm assembly complex protein 1 [Echinops telfairi]|uniref:Distal membrane-arm assembly complex protein 1 n=1 Tax=Echinops telfairi TaxID=9371 RepID=A0ABM0ZRD3_ECHTE|nr:distal membrane-arm assembly complex protein 1 [Echinops telfairi]
MGAQQSEPQDREKVVPAPASPAPLPAPASPAPASPAPLPAPEALTSPAQGSLTANCWSCRVLAGSGLIGAGGYVYWTARTPMKLGYPPGPGTITQMVVGISIAAWGVVVLTDPKGKAKRVDEK